MTWIGIADRLAAPVVLIVTGIVLMAGGQEDLGLVLVAGAGGILLPQRVSALRPRRP